MWVGILALVTIGLPRAVGIGRNLLRWYKAQELPPLQPGHELAEWSDFQVTGRVTSLQWLSVVLSGFLFLLILFGMMKPERALMEWHYFELQCLTQPSDQGVS